VTLTRLKLPTSIAVTATHASEAGPVTLTATVTGPTGHPKPSGTAEFQSGTNVCSALRRYERRRNAPKPPLSPPVRRSTATLTSSDYATSAATTAVDPAPAVQPQPDQGSGDPQSLPRPPRSKVRAAGLARAGSAPAGTDHLASSAQALPWPTSPSASPAADVHHLHGALVDSREDGGEGRLQDREREPPRRAPTSARSRVADLQGRPDEADDRDPVDVVKPGKKAKRFSLRLSQPLGAALQRTSATGTIRP